MSQTGIRRYRDTLLFALAYGAVVGAIFFAHPFRDVPDAPSVVAAAPAR